MHAVAVVFDFVEPLIAIRRGVDQLRELRHDPRRRRRRVGAPARYAGRHESRIRLSGRGMLLLEMVDLAACFAAWASSKVIPLQCRQVGKRRPLITVTSCSMSACTGSCVTL